MNPEIDLNQLVDEFCDLKNTWKSSKQYERVVAAPVAVRLISYFLEQDWPTVRGGYKYNQAGSTRWSPRRDTQRLRFAARKAH